MAATVVVVLCLPVSSSKVAVVTVSHVVSARYKMAATVVVVFCLPVSSSKVALVTVSHVVPARYKMAATVVVVLCLPVSSSKVAVVTVSHAVSARYKMAATVVVVLCLPVSSSKVAVVTVSHVVSARYMMGLCAACQFFVSFFGFLAWKTYTPGVRQTNSRSNDHNSPTIPVTEISTTSNGHDNGHTLSSGVDNVTFVPTNNESIVYESYL